jgi:hypothetical protein
MEKKSKPTVSSEFPAYFKITAIGAALVSVYAVFLVAMEAFAGK